MTTANSTQGATLTNKGQGVEKLKRTPAACALTEPDLKALSPILVIDTREPENAGWEPQFSLPTVRKCLETGYYSLLGCAEPISIELKALPDLIACFCGERERFTQELKRLQSIPSRWVIVEGSYSSLLRGDYRSQMNPKAAFESCVAMMVRFSIPVIMAGDCETAARLCESLLVRWFKEHTRVIETVAKATATNMKKGIPCRKQM